MIIVFVAAILGSALGYYLSEMLLDSIYEVYQSGNITSLIIPTIIILLVSLITISGKVYGAANKNPVDAIKYE
jgi:ABC-type antimicrobial peptide transport system permease subunit